MFTQSSEKMIKLIKDGIAGLIPKVEAEIPETGRSLPSNMFYKTKNGEWMGVVSVKAFGTEANQRCLIVGITKSFFGSNISNIVKKGTKSELLEYLSDENTPKEIFNDMLELYKEAVKSTA